MRRSEASQRGPSALPAPVALRLLIALVALALPLPASHAAAQSSTPGSASTSANTSTVTGTVYDSLSGKPLGGALVQVVARGESPRAWSSTTGVNGEFELSDIPRGLYLVGFLHPSLDSLGLGAPQHVLDIGDATTVHIDLAVPSASTIRKQLCPAAQAGDSTGLVLGFIRDADTGAPLGGATMVVIWAELVVEEGVHTARRQVPVESNSEGWYALCGIPTDGPITARAELGEDASGYIEISVPPQSLLHQDFGIPRGRAAASVAGADSNSGGDRPRYGTARLSGVVRNAQGKPLGGAQLIVWGSNATGSAADDGSFTLSNLPAGTQALEARYVGYAPRRVTVDLASGETRSVTVTLDERADVLSGVTVYGKRGKRHSDITGFLERRKRGIGKFITRDDIARRKPYNFTDIMRTVPGMKLVPTSYFNYTIVSSRGGGMGDGVCEPQIYIDGARLVDETEIDAMLRPSDIAGIEVYPGPSESPPQYTNGTCGSILVWTGPELGTTRND